VRNRELGSAVDLPVHVGGRLLRRDELEAEVDPMAVRQDHSGVVGRRGGLEAPDPQKGLQRGPRDASANLATRGHKGIVGGVDAQELDERPL
jgi:hypothetical protein